MPPASNNDSQGLKIAVAAFVSLSVILAVTSYFLYSAYAKADAQFTAAEQKAQTSQGAANIAQLQYEEMLKRIGSRGADFEAAKAEIQAEQKKVDDDINTLVGQANEAIARVKAAGASGPELDDVTTKVQQISSAYQTEPNKNYISSLARIKDLLRAMVLLDLEVTRDYTALKKNLESTNTVNQGKLKVASDAMSGAKADLLGEHTKHGQDRDELLTKVDTLQTENQRQATEIATLNTKIRQMDEDSTKKLSLAQTTLRQYRDQLERKATVLDTPDGRLTHVDYGRFEVHTNLTRSMGARPQMNFTIFDKNAAGIPTDKPKGTIELVQVGDAYSIGRIVKTITPTNPLRDGDIVYSPAWSPNEPMRFALIGKIDVNRDGRDDRAELKRMIEAAGGIVDYDLPPPGAGKESGELTGRVAWYVFDERMPFVTEYKTSEVTTAEEADHLKKKSDAMREARLAGVRPMPVERALSYLGYDYHAPVRGRAEAVDKATLRRILSPKQRDPNSPGPAPGAQPGSEAPAEGPPANNP